MMKIIFYFLLVFLLGCSNNETIVKEEKIPNKVEYNILKGMNYVQKGDYTNGIKELESALKKDPQNNIINRELAFAYSEIGDYTKGEYYYKKVLESDKKDLNSLENLSYLYYKQKRIELAQSYLDKIPKNQRGLSLEKLQGYIYIEMGELDKGYNTLKNISRERTSYNNEFFQKYLNLLKDLNKNEELYKTLYDNYSLYKNEKEYILLFAQYLDQTYNEKEEGKKAIKRYLLENPGDSEMVFELLKLVISDKDYNQGKEIAEYIEEEYKYNREYLNILMEIESAKVMKK